LFLLSPSKWMVFMLLSLARWCLLVGHLFCFDLFLFLPFLFQVDVFHVIKFDKDQSLGWTLILRESMIKYAKERYLIFFLENIHKLNFNTLNSWTFFILMINKREVLKLHCIILKDYMFWFTFKYIFRNTSTWKYVSHFWTSIWKCEENTIIIKVFILSNGWSINMYQSVLNFCIL